MTTTASPALVYQQTASIQTQGRSTINISRELNDAIANSGIQQGICHCFIRHTSASLIVTENADPDVRRDLEYFMQKLVQDGDPNYFHQDEGPDDMSAHIRTVLTETAISVPVTDGRAAMGTWQSLFLWEHRTHPHRRSVIFTVYGN